MRSTSAHELLKTRICAMPGCPEEAIASSDLCARHDREELVKFGLAPPSSEVDESMAEVEEVLAKGKRIGRPPTWSRESALEALRRFARERGDSPRVSDLRLGGDLPSHRTLCRLFGSLSGALVAAGLPTRGRGQRAPALRESPGHTPTYPRGSQPLSAGCNHEGETLSLRELRERHDLSLREVEGRTGISRATLSRIERGLEVPSPVHLVELSRLYGVPAESWRLCLEYRIAAELVPRSKRHEEVTHGNRHR